MDPAQTNAHPTVKEPRFGTKVSIAGIIIGILWAMPFINSHPKEGRVFTQGTVVAHDIAPKGICSPIAELVVDGVSYRTDPGFGAEPCEHAIGDPIEVAYHPDDIEGTLQIPYDEKETRQMIVISLPGWALLIGSTISLVNNIRYRRQAKQAQA